ncbi:hypothetical protein [Streptomyces sp. FH025]|uniref:hypothetical protein n=1 Tax=Streptomyces sp. FH025 TaxID=2815937 RepID=UPI0027DDF758|nr:hypothetical protein [Streptomyces sp. FH025]
MEQPIKMPGPAARGDARWATLAGCKRVLVAVHTLVYAQRLRDIFALLGSDLRVQVVFTVVPHAFNDGVAGYLQALGGTVLPWDVAVGVEFDLVLAAGSQGLEQVRGPVVRLPHGAGHQKLALAGAGGERSVSGLGREFLFWEGRLTCASYALAHRDDLAELASSCPEALDVAEVVGDGDHDRLAASLPHRAEYRRALGLREDERFVLVCSTWGTGSVLGQPDGLLPRLAGELPADRFRTAMLVHPNAFSSHGSWQVSSWVTAATRGTVTLITPETDWRPLLAAADYVIGDHGSVTLYASMTPAPILLARFPHRDVNLRSPGAQLARTAPALSAAHPLDRQLAYAEEQYRREEYAPIAARISSEPGRFSRNMRRLLYRVLELGQPAHAPEDGPVPLPQPLSGGPRWR